MLGIVRLSRENSGRPARILSTDHLLHGFLSPRQEMSEVTPEDYYEKCMEWERRKNGNCFCILLDNSPVGSISMVHNSEETASTGLWIESAYWNMGLGTEALTIFKEIVKRRGYKFLKASILKNNPRSKRIFEKCGAVFEEDDLRWYAAIALGH